MVEGLSKQSDRARPNPVVLVPGFMASNLWRKPRLLLTPPLPAWPLNAVGLTGQLLLLQMTTKLEADGLVRGYYDRLVEFATSETGLGRVPGQNFWTFAYDWRQSGRVAGQQLATFLTERLQEANAYQKTAGLPPFEAIDVIAHSWGGVVTRAARQLYDAPIDRTVYLAVPHYGVAKAFFALHPDTVTALLDDFIEDFLPGQYWNLLKVLPNVIFLREWLARLLASLPAMYELLPDRYLLEQPERALVLDGTRRPLRPVTGVVDTYYRHGWQLPATQQIRVAEAMLFKEDLGPTLPGEHNLLIYSATEPTYAQATYELRLSTPTLLPIGDTTVTAASANPDQPAQRVAVEGRHSQLPSLPAVHELIKDFLR